MVMGLYSTPSLWCGWWWRWCWKYVHGCIYIYIYTSAGRKFALLEGLSHDLVCTGSIYNVNLAWQVWHGQLSPRCKSNKLKSFSGVEIDQNHVDKRILGGKGFAVGRLKRHNFCPASVYMILFMYVYVYVCEPCDESVMLISFLPCISQCFVQYHQSKTTFTQILSDFFDFSCQIHRIRFMLLSCRFQANFCRIHVRCMPDSVEFSLAGLQIPFGCFDTALIRLC